MERQKQQQQQQSPSATSAASSSPSPQHTTTSNDCVPDKQTGFSRSNNNNNRRPLKKRAVRRCNSRAPSTTTTNVDGVVVAPIDVLYTKPTTNAAPSFNVTTNTHNISSTPKPHPIRQTSSFMIESILAAVAASATPTTSNPSAVAPACNTNTVPFIPPPFDINMAAAAAAAAAALLNNNNHNDTNNANFGLAHWLRFATPMCVPYLASLTQQPSAHQPLPFGVNHQNINGTFWPPRLGGGFAPAPATRGGSSVLSASPSVSPAINPLQHPHKNAFRLATGPSSCGTMNDSKTAFSAEDDENDDEEQEHEVRRQPKITAPAAAAFSARSGSPLCALVEMTTKTLDEINEDVKKASMKRALGERSLAEAAKKKRKSRTAFTNPQVFELEKRFATLKYLNPADRDDLAQRLGLTNAQVITWFQNRRAKYKRDLEELQKDVSAARNSHSMFFHQMFGAFPGSMPPPPTSKSSYDALGMPSPNGLLPFFAPPSSTSSSSSLRPTNDLPCQQPLHAMTSKQPQFCTDSVASKPALFGGINPATMFPLCTLANNLPCNSTVRSPINSSQHFANLQQMSCFRAVGSTGPQLTAPSFITATNSTFKVEK